jgi:hypothetical protein
VAFGALLVSFMPDILLLFADPAPFPGINAATVGTLMVMHVVTWAISVELLLRFGRETLG